MVKVSTCEAMLCLLGRATLTALPQEVLEMVVNKLQVDDKVCSVPAPVPSCVTEERSILSCSNCGCVAVQNQLAVCCKAMLPVLSMGHVRLTIDPMNGSSPLLPLTRRVTTRQPSGVSHLEVTSIDGRRRHMHRLMEVR